MSSNRPAEINTIEQRLHQALLAIEAIYAALDTTIEATTYKKHPHSQARKQVYELIKNALSKEMLSAIDFATLDYKALEALFAGYSKQLVMFYKESQAPQELTDDDKAFFEMIIRIFKAVILTCSNLHTLASNLRIFTDSYRADFIRRLNAEKLRIDGVDAQIANVATLDNRLHVIYRDIQAHNTRRQQLHGQQHPTRNSYASQYQQLTYDYDLLRRQTYQLAQDAGRLAGQKETALGRLANSTNPARLVNLYNQYVNQYNIKLREYRATKARLDATTMTLYQDAKQIIDGYEGEIKRFNTTLAERNQFISDQCEQLKTISDRIDILKKHIAATTQNHTKLSTPAEAVLSVEHSAPQAICTKLKERGWTTAKNDMSWVTLAAAITAELRTLSQPFELPSTHTLAALTDEVTTNGHRVYNAYGQQKPIRPLTSDAPETVALINRQRGTLLETSNAIQSTLDQLKAVETLEHSAQPEPVRQAKQTVASKPTGIFRNHWKTMLGAFVVGALLTAATLTTFGVFSFFALGVGSSLAIATASVVGGLAVSGISGLVSHTIARCSNRRDDQIQIDDAPEESPKSGPMPAPARNVEAARSAAPSTSARANVVAFAPRRPQRTGFFARDDAPATQLFHTDNRLLTELTQVIAWLDSKPGKSLSTMNDIRQLRTLESTLVEGYDVSFKEPLAQRFLALRGQYRAQLPNARQSHR